MSSDSGQGQSYCTPRRTQKNLFGPTGSSSKRSLFQEESAYKLGDRSPGEDSDIGPMSPLALSDRSTSISIGSSPGRQYDSPFASPENLSSPIGRISWDRLLPSSGKLSISPFSSLKKLSRIARSGKPVPRRKIFPQSPSPVKCLPGTPQKDDLSNSEIIPETPPRITGNQLQTEQITVTPLKSDSPEHKLVTPLGSVTKSVLLPKLHRRKSLSNFDEGDISPEKKENLKRHANDNLGHSTTKLIKSDEFSAVPKARASLFQEKKEETNLEKFTMSTKSFYSKSNPSNHQRSVDLKKFTDVGKITTKKRSPPVHHNHYTSNGQRRSLKRRKMGEINVGVGHGIKKPKPRTNLNGSKRFSTSSNENKNPMNTSLEKKQSTDVKQKHVSKDKKQGISPEVPVEKTKSPVIDPNKRFFKTNRTIRSSNIATVTVNKSIKLKVADGKIALNNASQSKKAKLSKVADLSFDTTDLTVDEPELETEADKTKVANILKELEKDWTDDDTDQMEILSNVAANNLKSPMKLGGFSTDIVMSPASELSNMTSTMNIEDISTPTTFENINFNTDIQSQASECDKDDNTRKYYPLFTKGYISDKMEEDAEKTTKSTKNPVNWQLSVKANGKDNQYMLDFGQKKFGATQCPECHIIYELGVPEDENAHLNYHNSKTILKFPGWKNERIVDEDHYTKSRVILVEPDDPKQYWKKVSDILGVIDRDLGLSEISTTEYHNKKIYLYVREKTVLSVLVAEPIKSAHHMIPELIDLNCCSVESTPAKCGINVVWTAMSHRRQGIASKMIDILRSKYYFGYIMSLDDIAFSMPTPNGKIFAEKYTKTKSFKVYS
ncbi:N-acetyltransferase ESCO2 isoform X2 [Prorops nasuta]